MVCSRSSSRCAAEGSVPRMGSTERMRRRGSGVSSASRSSSSGLAQDDRPAPRCTRQIADGGAMTVLECQRLGMNSTFARAGRWPDLEREAIAFAAWYAKRLALSPRRSALRRSARFTAWYAKRLALSLTGPLLPIPPALRPRSPVRGDPRWYGAPGEIRTPDPLVRSQVLYPTELRAREGARL